MVCHDIAEILLKLALNTNQSTVFMVCIEKLDVIQVKVLLHKLKEKKKVLLLLFYNSQ
jgi:hypothetical protein